MRTILRLLPDNFTLAILGSVALALLLPVGGEAARWVSVGSEIAIALLFFLQGARLSRAAVVAGILHWRLHLLIFAATFVLFPLLGLALRPLSGTVLTEPLYVGVLFLCTLPSAVQASVIFTSLAGGNVAAALCSASLSSIIGMALTPLLVGLLLQAQGQASLHGIESIALHILAPFVVGQLLQHWLAGWLDRHARAVRLVDRASVLLMVYGALSASTRSGLWSQLPVESLVALILTDTALLAAMLSATALAARGLGLSREDEIAIVFCGSKKSLVTGIPMANALFAGPIVGFVVLPLMIFHQLQSMACATLARRYALGNEARGTAIAETESA